MTKTGTTSTDYIPDKDDDFFNFDEQLVVVLEEVTEVGGITQENWKHWKIDEAKFKRLKEDSLAYIKLYKKVQAKKDRTPADVDTHREARKDLEAYIRKFVNQYIRYEDQVPRKQKIRMGILPKDEDPSTVHGSHLVTGAPLVGLKNKDGSVIDILFRRTKDQTRASMLKGFMAEISYQIGGTQPPDPDAPGMKSEISGKAHFQFTAGMNNLGKTFFAFGRYKHKTNKTLNTPWTNIMQITIA